MVEEEGRTGRWVSVSGPEKRNAKWFSKKMASLLCLLQQSFLSGARLFSSGALHFMKVLTSTPLLPFLSRPSQVLPGRPVSLGLSLCTLV